MESLGVTGFPTRFQAILMSLKGESCSRPDPGLTPTEVCSAEEQIHLSPRMTEGEEFVCLGDHNQVPGTFSSHSSGGWKSRSRYGQGWALGGLLQKPSHLLPVSSHALSSVIYRNRERERECMLSGVSFLMRTLPLLDEGPTLTISSNLN